MENLSEKHDDNNSNTMLASVLSYTKEKLSITQKMMNKDKGLDYGHSQFLSGLHVNEFETIDIVREESDLILIVFEACYEYARYSNETINAKLDKHDKIGLPECPYCESSEYTLKNKSLDGFTYQCNNCDRTFTY